MVRVGRRAIRPGGDDYHVGQEKELMESSNISRVVVLPMLKLIDDRDGDGDGQAREPAHPGRYGLSLPPSSVLSTCYNHSITIVGVGKRGA